MRPPDSLGLGRRRLLKTAIATVVAAPMVNLGRYNVFAAEERKYSARAIRLIESSLVVDMLSPLKLDFRPEAYANPLTDQEAEDFRRSGITAFHNSIGLDDGPAAHEQALSFLAAWQGFAGRNAAVFSLVGQAANLDRAKTQRKIAVIMGIQSADHFRTPQDVKAFYELGLRCTQLTYNSQNRIGSGCNRASQHRRLRGETNGFRDGTVVFEAGCPSRASLVRSALLISASIVVVSVLATLIIFPLVYQYGLNPAQGVDLVFSVLPTVFAEMPGGRLVGTSFFVLLVFAALTPTLAGIEPIVAWLQQSYGLARSRAALITATSVSVLGIGSVLSFNALSHWHPLKMIPRFQGMTMFDAIDFIASNLLLPIGALLTCNLIGWRLPGSLGDSELPEEGALTRRAIRMLLRYVCPLAIAVVPVAALA